MNNYTTNENDVTVFADTNFRNQRQRFGIKRRDRRSHMYIIGKTGMGKSTLMENLIYADLCKGEGLAVIDPYGDLALRVRNLIPPERQADLIYFDPADMQNPLGFNMLESHGREQHHLIASDLVSVFKKIWLDSWGPRTEYILRNTILALLEVPQATLLDLPKMLNDKEYRAAVLTLIIDEQVKDFWINEYAGYSARFRSEAIAPIQNKVGQFLTNRLIRGIISQKQSSFDIRRLMDEGKILITNLAKGKVGEDVSNLLGAMLLTRIELAALSRADVPEERRRDFYVYADEFYNFTTASFANVLAEARKYRLNLILANQYIEQLEQELRAAIFGNVGTLVSFRLGASDAEYVAREFYPVFSETDFIDLPQYHINLKLMIDGVSQSPFSAVTLPPTLVPLSF
jgi:hypothetical protein